MQINFEGKVVNVWKGPYFDLLSEMLRTKVINKSLNR